MTEPGPWSSLPPQPPEQVPAGSWGVPGEQPAGNWGRRPPKQPRPQTTVPWYAAILMALIAAVLAGAISGVIVHRHDSHHKVSVVTIGSRSDGHAVTRRASESEAAAASKILPSVVSIEVKTATGGAGGSGFVLSPSGYIMTNAHVVAAVHSGGKLSVILPDKSEVPAKIVGHPDVVDDIAVLKVDGVHGLHPAEFGNSSDLVVGDRVLVVGSPLGLAGTVTGGIVSALDRPVEPGGETGGPTDLIDAIQTDAAINPGNSGGPLVDVSGAVVGVNAALASLSGSAASGESGGSIGLGFAIPIDEARRIGSQIIRQGYATHAIIGVSLDATFSGSGARVAQSPVGNTPAVTPAGPAAHAGIHAGDVIVAVNGEKVTTADELIVAIRRRLPGSQLSLTYLRDGHRTTVTVTLGSQRSE
jgi:putative serine protease PepD